MPGVARTVYYAAMSLDGFIAEPEEKLDWLMGFEGQDFAGEGVRPMEEDYPAFIEGIGSLSMGSKTYEFMLDHQPWPYGDTPCWVLTTRDLPRVEGDEAIRFVSEDVATLHAEMVEAAGERDHWVIGGGELASQFVEAGLLELVQLTVVPVILGDGLPLFARPVPPMRLLEAYPFDSGMARLSYAIGGAGDPGS